MSSSTVETKPAEMTEVEKLREDFENFREEVSTDLVMMKLAIRGILDADDLEMGEVREASEMLRDRIDQLEEKTSAQSEQLEMFTLTDGGRKKPDERAQYLRQVLYNKAKKSANGMASMDKDSANAALGGELARATVMDALRRAADGEDADIDGSSKLENIPAIQFKKFDDPDKLSRVQIDLSDLTDREARKNLTTGETDKGV